MDRVSMLFASYPSLQALYLCCVRLRASLDGDITSRKRFVIDVHGAPLSSDVGFAVEVQRTSGSGKETEEVHSLEEELVRISSFLEAGAYDEHELERLEERAERICESIREALYEKFGLGAPDDDEGAATLLN